MFTCKDKTYSDRLSWMFDVLVGVFNFLQGMTRIDLLIKRGGVLNKQIQNLLTSYIVPH